MALLLKAGADQTVVDDSEHTARYYAEKSGAKTVLEAFETFDQANLDLASDEEFEDDEEEPEEEQETDEQARARRLKEKAIQGRP